MAAVCGVCKKKDQKFAPVEWCTECQKALCSTCSQKHKQDKHSKDHDTMSYNDYLQLPPFIKNLNQTCPNHNEKLLYLCREHDQLICNKCLKTKHKKCEETPVLKDIVKRVKTSHAFEDATCQLEETAKILQNGIKKLQHSLNGVQHQRKEMAKNVEETMDRIMTELKNLKKDMLSDIDVTVKKTEKNILQTMEKLQAMEQGLKEISDQKQSIAQHATNLQTYLGIKKMETVVAEATSSLTELKHNGAFDSSYIGLDKARTMPLDKVGLFGKINVTRTPTDMSLETSKNQEEQKLTHTLPQQLQLQQTVDLGYGNYWSCCTLPNGLVVVTDYRKKQLKLINPDGTLKSTIKIDDNLFDVTAVDETCVAVSHITTISMIDVSTEITTISMIDVSTEKVIRSWDTGNTVRGISYTVGYIIFCAAGIGIKKINIDTGTIHNVINDEDVKYDSYVVTGSDRICYPCRDKHTVTVLNLQHDVIFKYKDTDRLGVPWGVTVDSNNNVYVTGYISCNVLVISPDGQKVRQLLSEDDGLDLPTGIHYDSYTKQLIVITDVGNTLCKYSLG